jgi:hypothetical protein
MVLRFAPDYLVVGANEDKSWTIDRDSLSSLPIVYRNTEWTVYRLTSARNRRVNLGGA